MAYHSKRERRRDGRVSPHSPNGAGHQANGYHNAHHQGGHFHGGAASQYLYDALASPAAHQQHHNVQHHHNEQTPFTNVYVKNLAANVDEQALRELFAPYGTITSCAVGVDENGRSRGFGFVNFDQCEAAMSAMQALNRVEVDSACVCVVWRQTHTHTHSHTHSHPQLDGKMLYVGRAQKKQERDEELRRRFESSVSLNEPSANGTDSPSPIGEHHGSAAYAPSNGFRPRRLVVNVYVRHIEDKVDEDHLFHAFAPFGNVLSTRVMRDENGISRGFGFVSYQTLDEARTAVQAMNEQMLFEGQKTPLYVALAQRKEQRMGGMLGGAMPTGGPMMKGLHRGGMHPVCSYVLGHNMLVIAQGYTVTAHTDDAAHDAERRHVPAAHVLSGSTACRPRERPCICWSRAPEHARSHDHALSRRGRPHVGSRLHADASPAVSAASF